MLIVRMRQHFRERQMEWALAGCATGWGAILMNSPTTFDRPFYTPLRRLAGAGTWGWGLFLLGLLGLTVLFINGAWHRTPLFRKISSSGRMFAWAGLLFGALSVEWQTPAAMVYTTLLFMEIMVLSNATADGERLRNAADGR